MADAMVTARMPPTKKAAGVAVLNDLGLTISDAINWVWDYLISNHALPQDAHDDVDRARIISGAKAEYASYQPLRLDDEALALYEGDRRAYRFRRVQELLGDALQEGERLDGEGRAHA